MWIWMSFKAPFGLQVLILDTSLVASKSFDGNHFLLMRQSSAHWIIGEVKDDQRSQLQ
jgi:hypothetical protein